MTTDHHQPWDPGASYWGEPPRTEGVPAGRPGAPNPFVVNNFRPDQANAHGVATGEPGRSPGTAGQPRRSRRAGVIAGIVAMLVAVAAGAAALGYQQGAANAAEQYRPQVQQAQAERDRAIVAQAAAEQSQSARTAEDSALPNLGRIATGYFGSSPAVRGDADYLEITITTADASSMSASLSQFLDALGFSPAVLERMSKTRALDGTRTAEGKNCNVSWTYHPDHGLQLVFEAKATG